jgi:carbon starvation protein
MTGSLLIVSIIVLVIIAYTTYGAFIARKLGIDPSRKTPAHSKSDNIDYVPTNRYVVLGHHFASIAGAGPIVGPVLAAAFGWLPVYLWILVGGIFMGAVHDFASTVASLRHEGKSIGEIIRIYIGERGKKYFLVFAFATMLLVVAVFTNIVATTFVQVPAAATASVGFIGLAIVFGIALRRSGVSLFPLTIIGVILLFTGIWFGEHNPLILSSDTDTAVNIWRLILLGYIFFSAVVPVWLLLQPRDYLNSFMLYAVMLGGLVGIVILNPTINLEAYRGLRVAMGADGALVWLFPILFVTVACGAISGFHSLVSSGTTAKQLDSEKDAKFVAYGGMLIEVVLAGVAIIAVATLATAQFTEFYSAGQYVAAFATGVGMFISAIPFLNISPDVGTTFAALAVSAFALTSLDTCCRLARYLFQEFFEGSEQPAMKKLASNRYIGTGFAVACGAALVFSGSAGSLWPMFGSANQLLAALALLAASVWLAQRGTDNWFVRYPMIFMFSVTLTALVMLGYNNYLVGNYLLTVIAAVLFILAITLAVQAARSLAAFRKKQKSEVTVIRKPAEIEE